MTGQSPPQRFQEVEIKLKLDERTYQELLKSFSAERSPALQENFFFDTPDYTLLKHHWALRIRKEEQDYYLTTKGPVEKNTDAYVRPEYETKIAREKFIACQKGFKLSVLASVPAQELLKRFGDLFVKPIFSFSNQRQFLKFEPWILELDYTTMKDHVFLELELETDLDSLARCRQQLKDLFKAHNWNYEPSAESKMEKAIRLFLNL